MIVHMLYVDDAFSDCKEWTSKKIDVSSVIVIRNFPKKPGFKLSKEKRVLIVGKPFCGGGRVLFH